MQQQYQQQAQSMAMDSAHMVFDSHQRNKTLCYTTHPQREAFKTCYLDYIKKVKRATKHYEVQKVFSELQSTQCFKRGRGDEQCLKEGVAMLLDAKVAFQESIEFI